MSADPAERPAPAALVRVPAEEAEDMGLFLANIRTDLGLARQSAAAVARLFPAWGPAMARLTAEIAALDAEAALLVALAQAGLAPAPRRGARRLRGRGRGRARGRDPVIVLAYEGGYLRVSWKGREIGRLDYVSGGMVAGQLAYEGALFDTDDYSLYGVPDHWIETKARAMCERQDRAKAERNAA